MYNESFNQVLIESLQIPFTFPQCTVQRGSFSKRHGKVEKLP